MQTYRVKDVADGPQLERNTGERVDDGGAEGLDQLQQVCPVLCQLGCVTESCWVHLKIFISHLEELENEWSHY